MIAQTQSVSLDTKNSVTSLMDDLSVLSDYTHAELPKNSIIFCPECWEIPQLSINTSNNKIISNCKENNHHKDYNLSEFCKKCIYHSLTNISCNICMQTYSQEKALPFSDKNSSNSNSKLNNSIVSQGPSTQFLYCEQCKDFFCIKCQKKHLKQKKNHLLIITSKIGVFCPFHNLSYSSYCFTCNKNICLKCVNKHISHKVVSFTKIKPLPQELNQKRMEINRERTELKKVEIVFKDSINQIYKKFNKLMEYKLEELNFKENIIMTFEMRTNNFNSINNFKNLNVNFPKFNYNLFSPNEITDDIMDDSIGIDKIRNIYDYLQNKKYLTLNLTRKNLAFNDEINNAEIEEDFIYPKKSNKKDIKNYSYINNDEDINDLEKRYYELAKSLDAKKIKKDKRKINENKTSKDNKTHYKINKEEGSNIKLNLRKYHPVNSNININDSNLNKSNDNINENEGIISGFPISKSWIKPNYIQSKSNKASIPKEERNFKLGDKYLGKIKNNKDKYYSHDNNENNLSVKGKEHNKRDNNLININSIKNDKEIDLKHYLTTDMNDKTERNSPNFYIKKFSIKQPKLKFGINSEKRNSNNFIISQPEIIKTIYDNKKEIMNLIILHDGNFCTSSWDSSIKIFNSETYELLLKINEPNNNDVCYVAQLNDDSIILCSNRIFKYRLSSFDREYTLETIISGYNDYIIKVIELKDNSIITCDWEYKIKVWKKVNNYNDNKNQYELIISNINEGEHLSSLARLNDNEFVSSSNSHLENGNDVLRFYDTNYNNYTTINNISCSELVDTLCQINEQYLCVALQKWSSNQIKGIAVIDIEKKQIIRTIQGDSMTCISLISSIDKIIITGGRDKTNKKSIIREWKLKNNGDLIQLFEICTEQKDAITSISKLKDGRIFASNYDSTIVVLK